MKIGVGKRILMFLHWLFSILICAALVISQFFPDVFTSALNFVQNLMGPYRKIGMIVLGSVIALIYAFLCIGQARLIFRRKQSKSDRGFIVVDSSDNSRVRIAISAIEQMVRQSVNNIDGISDMKIAISSVDDAIVININACIIAGRHVPTITLNMQQAIRKFVEMNCGVAVQTVAVSINSVTSADGSGKKKRVKASKQEAVAIEPVIPVPAIEPEIIPVDVCEEEAFIEAQDEAVITDANEEVVTVCSEEECPEAAEETDQEALIDEDAVFEEIASEEELPEKQE